MRKPANEIPNYLKYGAYIIAHQASINETATVYGVTTKQVRDDINHGLKNKAALMYTHVKNIQSSKK